LHIWEFTQHRKPRTFAAAKTKPDAKPKAPDDAAAPDHHAKLQSRVSKLKRNKPQQPVRTGDST
jgi:hypothetical protein